MRVERVSNCTSRVQFETLSTLTSSSKESNCASTSNGCSRCYEIDVDAYATNVKLIDELQCQIKALKGKAQQGKVDDDEAKAKYARSAYTNSRSPHIKDGIVYTHGGKHNARAVSYTHLTLPTKP